MITAAHPFADRGSEVAASGEGGRECEKRRALFLARRNPSAQIAK